MVMNAIEELLSAVTTVADAEAGTGQAAASTPTFLPSASDEAMEEIASASAQLHAVVQRIRAQFLRLADIEIRKALDAALGSALSMPLPQAAPPVARPATAPARSHRAAEPVADETAVPAKQGRASAPEAGEPQAGTPQAGTMEGTVRLMVFADGNMRRVIKFVDELCQRPQFRMLRMAGSPSQNGAVVSVALREPVAFRGVLTEMGMVSSVEESTDASIPGDGPLLTVHLRPV